MIPAERAHLRVAARSHPGISGKNNEDRFAVSAYKIGTENPTPSVLAVIADGIGGHRAGEVAAELAVKTISRVVTEGDPHQPVETLRQAVILASQAIFNQSENEQAQKGMGSTCACGWIIGNRLYTASVGDSRIYLLRGNTIHQLSTDHTWVQEAIDHGALTPEQARDHPNAHVIRRYLGSRQPVVPDLRLRLRPGEDDERAESNQGFRLLPGDHIFLCSDGLTDLVDDAEILSALKSYSQEEALEELVSLANRRGGHDNITVVALQMPEAAHQTVPVATTRGKQRLSLTCLGLGTLILIGALLVSGLYWYITHPSEPVTSLATASVTLPPATHALDTQTPLPLPSQTPFSMLTETSLPSISTTATPGSLSPAATLTPWPTNTRTP